MSMPQPTNPPRLRFLRLRIKILGWSCLTMLVLFCTPVYAFKHHKSPVHFLEYTPQIVQQNKGRSKPYFLLFSAQWCHWCKVFEEKTLSKQRVHSFLNEHFVNVFIDADIHSGAYLKYKAKGVPYTVFTYVALLPWQLFSKAMSDSGRSLVSNRNMITKIYFPRLVIPLSTVLSGLVDFFIAFLILVGMMVYYKLT